MTSFLERMRKIDRTYSSEGHQRLFLQRMNELERRHPCKKDHASSVACDTRHAQNDVLRHPAAEHGPCCYSDAQLKEVYAWQTSLTQSS